MGFMGKIYSVYKCIFFFKLVNRFSDKIFFLGIRGWCVYCFVWYLIGILEVFSRVSFVYDWFLCSVLFVGVVGVVYVVCFGLL